MAVSKFKKRPLARYIKDLKYSQTHCIECQKDIERVTVVYQGQIMNVAAIARLDIKLDEAGWEEEKEKWLVLCRMCGILHCEERCDYFDLNGFKIYLLEDGDVSHASQREYIARIRRLGQHLRSNDVEVDLNEEGYLGLYPEAWLPKISTQTYRVVLKKYTDFLVFVKKNKSQPPRVILKSIMVQDKNCS